MKKSIYILLFIAFSSNLKSQDLIITQSNDSIICRILKQTDDSIYYRTYENRIWHYNEIAKSNILNTSGKYKPLSFNYRHRPVSLFLEFAGATYFYSANIDLNVLVYKQNKLFARAGMGPDIFSGTIRTFAFGYLYGRNHNLEISLGANSKTEFRVYPISIGYRYVGRKGFLFRATPMYLHNTSGNVLYFGLSLGFSI